MNKMEYAFEKIGIKGGSEMKKTCRMCKKPLKDDKYDTCYECSQKNKGTYDGLSSDYLSKGYFNEKEYLWEDLITTTAEEAV